LKNRLPYYLRRAKRGEEIIVTERGQPVAILQSLRGVDRPSTLDARLAKLASLGIVTLPAGRGFGRARPLRVRGRPISRVILEDRR
jgi:prevent-host-death family protein